MLSKWFCIMRQRRKTNSDLLENKENTFWQPCRTCLPAEIKFELAHILLWCMISWVERSPVLAALCPLTLQTTWKQNKNALIHLGCSWIILCHSWCSNATPKAARLFTFARVQFRDVDDGHYFHSCCLFGYKILRGCMYFFNGRSKCSNTKCNSTAVCKYSLKH